MQTLYKLCSSKSLDSGVRMCISQFDTSRLCLHCLDPGPCASGAGGGRLVFEVYSSGTGRPGRSLTTRVPFS